MDRSESIKELAMSLCKAQLAMGAAAKGSVNPHFKKSYSSFSDVVEAIKAPFGDNGLAFIQLPSFSDGLVTVETVIMHSSGEWISSSLSVPIDAKKDAQAVGKALSYTKRYGIQAMAGLPSEDDDGNSASVIGSTKTYNSPPARQAPANQSPVNHSVIIAKYNALDQPGRDQLWAKITPEQQAAINESYK